MRMAANIYSSSNALAGHDVERTFNKTTGQWYDFSSTHQHDSRALVQVLSARAHAVMYVTNYPAPRMRERG